MVLVSWAWSFETPSRVAETCWEPHQEQNQFSQSRSMVTEQNKNAKMSTFKDPDSQERKLYGAWDGNARGPFVCIVAAQIEKLSLCATHHLKTFLSLLSASDERKRQPPPLPPLRRMNEGFKSFGEFFSLPPNFSLWLAGCGPEPYKYALKSHHSGECRAKRALRQIIRNLIAAGWFVGQQKVSQCQNFDAFLQAAHADELKFSRANFAQPAVKKFWRRKVIRGSGGGGGDDGPMFEAGARSQLNPRHLLSQFFLWR